jgi:PAS domain S-box-containing protein
LQQSLQSQPFLRSISLLDAQGHVVASSSPANLGRTVLLTRLTKPRRNSGLGPLLPGRDLADLDTPAAQGPREASTAHLLPMVLPLDEQRPAEFLVAAINPDYFANQYEVLLDEAPVRAALLSLEGDLLAASSGITAAVGSNHPRLRAFTDYLPNRERGRFLDTSVNGDRALIAFRTARRQPLVVIAEIAEAKVIEDLMAMGRNVALGTLILLAMIAALGTLAWRSLRSHEQVSNDLEAARGSMAAQDAFTDRLFQVSPIPMAIKDTQGCFVRVNKAWSDFTGQSSERVIGLNMGRLYPAQLAAPHEVQEQMAMASGNPVTYEDQMLDSDGLPRDVMIRLMPFTDADGHVAGLIGCLMDVTEFREAAQRTREAKEAAERANAAKSEFLANISHELRTPLQAILGFSELGTLRTRADARVSAMFNDIHGAGNRMLNLVNNLLDLSRLESPVGEIQRRLIDIVPHLTEVTQELAHMAQSRGLNLVLPEAQPESPALWALADGFRLQQVLRNVLANAIRFAPPGSDVKLEWHADAHGQLRVSVRDHGPGIPEDELESIFEAFVQSTRTKDGSGGTGLGLAICRKIMEAHEGHITARNHPQGGAVFEISLPAHAGATAPMNLSASSLG